MNKVRHQTIGQVSRNLIFHGVKIRRTKKNLSHDREEGSLQIPRNFSEHVWRSGTPGITFREKSSAGTFQTSHL